MVTALEKRIIRPSELPKDLPTAYESLFPMERVNPVIEAMPFDPIVQAMIDAQSLPPTADPRAIAGGEGPRLKTVAVLYDTLYGVPKMIGIDSGILPRRNIYEHELGPSLGGHKAIENPDFQPASYIGVDYQKHIVKAAEVAIQAWKEHELLRADGSFNVILGDHNTDIGRGDLAYANLLAQYAGGYESLKWVLRNGRLGVVGDANHGIGPISDSEWRRGILPMKYRDPQGRYHSTGVNWERGDRVMKTDLGTIYKATLATDRQIYGNNRIHQFTMGGDSYETNITVYEQAGERLLQGWAYNPTQATDKDILRIKALRRTLDDVYKNVQHVANEHWGGNNQLAVADIIAREEPELYAIVRLTTHPKMSGNIVPAILRRHGREVDLLNKAGLLSQVGEKRYFPHLEDLTEAINEWSKPPVIDKLFSLSTPIIGATISTRVPTDYQAMKAVAAVFE